MLLQGVNPADIKLEDAVKLLADKAVKVASRASARKGIKAAARSSAATAKASKIPDEKAASSKAASSKTGTKAKTSNSAKEKGTPERPVRRSKAVGTNEESPVAGNGSGIGSLPEAQVGRGRKKAVKAAVAQGDGAATADEPVKAKRGRPKKAGV